MTLSSIDRRTALIVVDLQRGLASLPLSHPFTSISRTWLAPDGSDKAPVSTPRRFMGHLVGHGIRFGATGEVVAAGEGVETLLSLRQIMPTLPVVAATSAGHLAAFELPGTLRRLYVARDDDPAGHAAAETLTAKAAQAGIEALILVPMLGDFNDDLRRFGRDALSTHVRVQLVPGDVARFLVIPRAHRWAG